MKTNRGVCRAALVVVDQFTLDPQLFQLARAATILCFSALRLCAGRRWGWFDCRASRHVCLAKVVEGRRASLMTLTTVSYNDKSCPEVGLHPVSRISNNLKPANRRRQLLRLVAVENCDTLTSVANNGRNGADPKCFAKPLSRGPRMQD